MVTILDGLRVERMAALIAKANGNGKKKVMLSIVRNKSNIKNKTKGNKDENPCSQ